MTIPKSHWKGRMINGERYDFYGTRYSKESVDKDKQWLKNHGYKVRVLKNKVGRSYIYELYKRKKI